MASSSAQTDSRIHNHACRERAEIHLDARLIAQSSDERSHEHEHDGDAREPPLEPRLLDDLSVLFDVGSASVRYLEEMRAVDRVGENVVGERGEIRVVWVLRVRLEKSV